MLVSQEQVIFQEVKTRLQEPSNKFRGIKATAAIVVQDSAADQLSLLIFCQNEALKLGC